VTAGADPAAVITFRMLVDDLRTLGVRRGQTLLVHASLREIGWVDGGAGTVVAALGWAVGRNGNIVVPAVTEENSLTSRAHLDRIAGMTEQEVKEFRAAMPAFERDTPAPGAGVIAEAVRTAPAAVRSVHPQSSFAAIGANAAKLMAGHSRECHYGERSPLRKLYDMNASILLLGVGYRACTALHLAEYRYIKDPPVRSYSCVVSSAGERHWTTYLDVVLDDQEFDIIGECIDNGADVTRGYVGAAPSRLLPLRSAVDRAAQWMAEHRTLGSAPILDGQPSKLRVTLL
jgi:aminoglycoside 3-N-acetyltransferase